MVGGSRGLYIISCCNYSPFTHLLDHWWSFREQLCRKPICTPERWCLGHHPLQPDPTAGRDAGPPSKYGEGARRMLWNYLALWVAWSWWKLALPLLLYVPYLSFLCLSFRFMLGLRVNFTERIAVAIILSWVLFFPWLGLAFWLLCPTHEIAPDISEWKHFLLLQS
jgi:hypothetical protein